MARLLSGGEIWAWPGPVMDHDHGHGRRPQKDRHPNMLSGAAAVRRERARRNRVQRCQRNGPALSHLLRCMTSSIGYLPPSSTHIPQTTHHHHTCRTCHTQHTLHSTHYTHTHPPPPPQPHMPHVPHTPHTIRHTPHTIHHTPHITHTHTRHHTHHNTHATHATHTPYTIHHTPHAIHHTHHNTHHTNHTPASARRRATMESGQRWLILNAKKARSPTLLLRNTTGQSTPALDTTLVAPPGGGSFTNASVLRRV